jgi:hypothetical protein
MKKIVCICALALSVTALRAAVAKENPFAIGVTVDLLPYAMSAGSGHAGFSLQSWAGIDHMRIRFVGAKIYLPEWITRSDRFRNQTLTVNAAVIDYCFGDYFDGFWIGTGYELWHHEITHTTDNTKLRWTSQVATIGGGYIFRFAGNAYVEPWAAAHCITNNRTIKSGGDSFRPKRVSAEVSLKLGYIFDFGSI